MVHFNDLIFALFYLLNMSHLQYDAFDELAYRVGKELSGTLKIPQNNSTFAKYCKQIEHRFKS